MKTDLDLWAELEHEHAELDSENQALTDMLGDAEKVLRQLHFGMYVSVPLYNSDETEVSFAIGREGRDWHLLRVEEPRGGAHGPDERTVKRLTTQASRSDRLLAAKKIPDLLRAILETSRHRRAEIRETRTTIGDLIAPKLKEVP